MKYLVPTLNELTHISEISCRYVVKDCLGIFGESPRHKLGPQVDSLDLRISLSCCDSLFLVVCFLVR